LGSPRCTTRSCSQAKLLVVDELGYLPLEPDAAHLFFQLVSRRHETGFALKTEAALGCRLRF
jgi:DNA replication protein DnaC